MRSGCSQMGFGVCLPTYNFLSLSLVDSPEEFSAWKEWCVILERCSKALSPEVLRRAAAKSLRIAGPLLLQKAQAAPSGPALQALALWYVEIMAAPATGILRGSCQAPEPCLGSLAPALGRFAPTGMPRSTQTAGCSFFFYFPQCPSGKSKK